MSIDVQTKKEVKEILKKELSSEGEIIEKTASINWDGKNFLIRIPKDVAWTSGLDEDNVFKKELKFKIVIDKSGEIKEKSFDIVERTTPKRKVRKHGKDKATNKKQ